MEHYVIVLDFGYPLDPGKRSTIDDLAEFVVEHYTDEPETVVLAQDYSYDFLCRTGFPKRRLLRVGTGQSATAGLSKGGSYHMLREACGMLERLGAREFDWVPFPCDWPASFSRSDRARGRPSGVAIFQERGDAKVTKNLNILAFCSSVL